MSGRGIYAPLRIDDYLVGCAALSALDIPWQGVNERWAWYLSPIYGETESGSRAGGIQKFSKPARQFCDADGFDRVLAIHNPTSPAALAVKSNHGKADILMGGNTLEETFGDAKTMTRTMLFGEHRDR